MQDDSLISDDPGTILDSFDHIPSAVPHARAGVPAVKEVLYMSTFRWAAPRILICDEGSLDQGEVFYIRSERVVIGRAKGDILIGHDVAMSGGHAEICRQDAGGHHTWVLHDLGSKNGTFARVRRVTLQHDLTIHMGSKRYRFEVPGAALAGISAGDGSHTLLLDNLATIPADRLPALVDTSSPADAPIRHPFRSTRVTIGRPRCGNDIEIDDLCLAAGHAVVARDASGSWQLEARPTLNSVWVKVDTIKLVDNCLFQCGEQRFRFRM